MQEAPTSKFQFANPRITSIDFKTNSSFDKTKYNGIGARFESNIHNKENHAAEVELKVALGMNAESVPFQLEASVSSVFIWEECLSDNDAENILNKNAKVLLLSYLRPFITHLIVDAGFPPLVLPFFDFSEEVDGDDKSALSDKSIDQK